MIVTPMTSGRAAGAPTFPAPSPSSPFFSILSLRRRRADGAVVPPAFGPRVVARSVRCVLAGMAIGAPCAGLADDATTLPAVTVTATQESKGTADEGYREDRVSQAGPWQGRGLQDTPYSITVFSEELMKNLQASSADQVFRINPTMQQTRSQHENNQPTVNLRGFSQYVSYRDGLQQDFFGHLATIEDTERIEVLNGLSGFLYGSGNVGGLVNYVTKRSTDERLAEITASSLGNKAWYLHGDFGGKIDAEGKFGYRLNLARQDGDTAIKGQTIDREFYSLILDWQPRRDLYFHVSAMKMDYDIHGSQANWSATAATRVPASRLRNDLSYGPHWTRRYYDTNRHTAHVKWDVNEAVSLRANLQTSSIVRNTSFPSATNIILSPTSYRQTIAHVFAPDVNNVYTATDDKRGAAYADFKFDTGPVNHKVTAGYQYSKGRISSWANAAPLVEAGPFPIDDPQYIDRPVVEPMSRGALSRSINRRNNLVIGDDITLTEQWSVLAGLARTRITGTNYDKSAVTPTLTLVYKPIPDLTTYVSYMESLEQGGIAAEIYQGARVVNAGTIFEPLKSKQIELGAKYSWRGMLFSGALFEIDKGLQYYDVTNPAAPVYVQDGRQVHRGVEFTAIGRVSTNLSILGGFTWLDPEVRENKQDPRLEGTRPALVSDKLFKMRAEYDLPVMPGLSVSAGFNRTSASYAALNNTDRLPGYTIYDLGARYRFGRASNPVTLRLDILNLTDKHYWATGAVLGLPRTVMLSASYRL